MMYIFNMNSLEEKVDVEALFPMVSLSISLKP